jgi:hypothetical protein
MVYARFCLEASYWCGLVGPGDGSEAVIFDLLELFTHPFLIKRRIRGGPPSRAANGDGRSYDSGVEQP